MKRYSVLIALSGVLALYASASAGDSVPVTALTISNTSRIALDPDDAMTLASPAEVPSPAVATFATGFTAPEAPSLATRTTILESVRWRPRRYRDRDRDRDRDSDRRESRRGSAGFSQIHGGFFDPDGEQEAGFVGGFRGGATIDNHVQLGVGIDWAHKSDRMTEVVSFVPLPGGGTSERRQELARSSSNLFPVMAFLQLSPGDENDVHPYFGVAGGYEALFLSAEDFTTGDQFDATYGGWGWQAWAGLAIPLSGKSSINVEIFRNTSEVERDVADPSTGDNYREIVDVDGVGMRFGLNWGF